MCAAGASLIKSAQQVQAVASFWDAYAPGVNHALSVKGPTMISEQWVYTSLQRAHMDPALESALLALAFSRLSRVDTNNSMRGEAMLQYDMTVKRIRKALQHPKRRFDDTLLAAVMVLATYEVRRLSSRTTR